MPELPEVETVARSLRRTVVGRTITAVEIHKTDRIFPNKSRFRKILSGSTFCGVRRRGKNLLIDLSNDYTLWVHLKMTGHFRLRPSTEPMEKHDHVVFHLADDTTDLRFNDYRRFGRLQVYPTSEIMNRKGLADLGPEPLEITADDFVSLLKSSHRMIKPALLDQTFIAGIGNIYADESLFRARIHPRRQTDSLSTPKIKFLHEQMQGILRKAIRLMGTSVDTFAGLNGNPGRFQKYLLVYGREDEPCPRCGRPIHREKIGSRSSHFCLHCQRKP